MNLTTGELRRFAIQALAELTPKRRSLRATWRACTNPTQMFNVLSYLETEANTPEHRKSVDCYLACMEYALASGVAEYCWNVEHVELAETHLIQVKEYIAGACLANDIAVNPEVNTDIYFLQRSANEGRTFFAPTFFNLKCHTGDPAKIKVFERQRDKAYRAFCDIIRSYYPTPPDFGQP